MSPDYLFVSYDYDWQHILSFYSLPLFERITHSSSLVLEETKLMASVNWISHVSISFWNHLWSLLSDFNKTFFNWWWFISINITFIFNIFIILKINCSYWFIIIIFVTFKNVPNILIILFLTALFSFSLKIFHIS